MGVEPVEVTLVFQQSRVHPLHPVLWQLSRWFSVLPIMGHPPLGETMRNLFFFLVSGVVKQTQVNSNVWYRVCFMDIWNVVTKMEEQTLSSQCWLLVKTLQIAGELVLFFPPPFLFRLGPYSSNKCWRCRNCTQCSRNHKQHFHPRVSNDFALEHPPWVDLSHVSGVSQWISSPRASAEPQVQLHLLVHGYKHAMNDPQRVRRAGQRAAD